MRHNIISACTVVLVALLMSTASSEAALNKKKGGSGTSANLSSNPAIRQQQLTVDPELLLDGQLTVDYDVKYFHVYQDYNETPGLGGYSIQGINGYQVDRITVLRNYPADDLTTPISLISPPQSSFFLPPEIGTLNFHFSLKSDTEPGPFLPPDANGDQHINIVTIDFEANDGVPSDYPAIFTVRADKFGFGYGPDYFHGKNDDGEYTVPADKIELASGSLPEPTALSFIGLAGLGLCARRRHRILGE